MNHRHRLALFSAVASAFWFAAWSSARFASDAQDSQLPGARPVIDAAKFKSLQAALDAVPEGGGLVRLPPGKFEIGKPLRVTRDDVWIEGAGTSTWIVNTATDGQPALLLEPPAEKGDAAYVWRLGLRHFRITGNPRSGHGILARRVNEILIDGVAVSRHGGDGIRLDHCYEDPRVCDSIITYNAATGLHLIGCHDIVVAANQFEENHDAVRCVDGFNLCMTGNNLDDHLGDGVVIENTYGSIVAGNMIEECKGTGVVLGRDCYGTAISANVIAHNFGGGVDLQDAWGSTVSANAFTIMGGNALTIGKDSGRIAVTGNSFADSYIGDDKVKRRPGDRMAGGIAIKGANDVALSGNLLSGLRPSGLHVDRATSRRILFTGNLSVDAPTEAKEIKESVWSGNLQSPRSPR